MRVLAVAGMVLLVALAGCGDDKGGPDGPGTPTSSATSTSTSMAPPAANLTADVADGEAPLAVNFTLNATAGAASWRLSFGDGAAANGTGQPAAANHTYSVAGNFSANLTVSYAGGAFANASLAIRVTLPAGSGSSRAPPDVTHFEFADSLGCVADAGVDRCVSFQGGPDASGIDGYWQALDERYWGLSFTTTVDQGQPARNDSDCAFTDAAFAILGDANNSDQPCAGTVPAGTAWIFLFPYALPALGQTLDFATA